MTKRLIILTFAFIVALSLSVAYADCKIDILRLSSKTWKETDSILGKVYRVEKEGRVYVRYYKPCHSFEKIQLYFYQNQVIGSAVIFSNNIHSYQEAASIMKISGLGSPSTRFPAGVRWYGNKKDFYELSIYTINKPIDAFILFISTEKWDNLSY